MDEIECSEYTAQSNQPKNSFCSDLIHHPDAFYDAISEVQPTVFFGTPAVYESLFYRLKELRRTMSGLQRMFLNWDETPAELFASYPNFNTG